MHVLGAATNSCSILVYTFFVSLCSFYCSRVGLFGSAKTTTKPQQHLPFFVTFISPRWKSSYVCMYAGSIGRGGGRRLYQLHQVSREVPRSGENKTNMQVSKTQERHLRPKVQFWGGGNLLEQITFCFWETPTGAKSRGLQPTVSSRLCTETLEQGVIGQRLTIYFEGRTELKRKNMLLRNPECRRHINDLQVSSRQTPENTICTM